MSKLRTIEEELAYLNRKISREKKLCENLENVYIPEAKKDFCGKYNIIHFDKDFKYNYFKHLLAQIKYNLRKEKE